MPTARELDRRILALAVPAVLTIAADPIYDLTDTAILGHLGRSALAGAALATVLLTTGYAVFIFLLYGTTATVARYLGAGEPARAAHHGVQAMWLASGLGVVVSALLWPLTPTLVALLGGKGSVAAAATTYFRVSLLGFPAFFLVMAGAGYLRGIQDLRTPLRISVSAVALNLVLEVVLVYGFDRGVGASAGGTAVAKWSAALAYLVLVGRSARAHGVGLRPDPAALRDVSSAGLPLFVRTVALRLALAFAVSVAGRIGDVELAAYAIAAQVASLVAYLCEGLEIAAHSLVGHALGASDAETARAVGRRLIRLGLLLGLACGVVLLAVSGVLPAVFTDDRAVQDVTTSSLWWVAAMMPIANVSYAFDGVFIGAADLRYLAGTMVVAAVGFVGLAVAVRALDLGLGALWAALIAFMGLRAGGLALRFRGDRWTRLGLRG